MTTTRSYKPSDQPSVIHVWETVFPDDPPHNAPRKMLEEKLKIDELIFVAEQQSSVVGACMAGYDGHRGWLYAVAVLPGHRRSGVGKQLVLHAIDALKNRGCGKVNLQIRADNVAVANFYTSLGFDVEERISMGIRLD